MRRQVLILKVFWGARRSRRDCGNREADFPSGMVTQLLSARIVFPLLVAGWRVKVVPPYALGLHLDPPSGSSFCF
jgi:hypothetical protein